jgi:hypothetical protein
VYEAVRQYEIKLLRALPVVRLAACAAQPEPMAGAVGQVYRAVAAPAGRVALGGYAAEAEAARIYAVATRLDARVDRRRDFSRSALAGCDAASGVRGVHLRLRRRPFLFTLIQTLWRRLRGRRVSSEAGQFCC